MFPFDFGTTESGDSQAPQQGDVMRNIGAFMGDPRVQGALLSSGIALMQPPSYGDNFVSQLGRAIGAAGESATAQQKQDIAQSESESKQDLRGAQADAAAARSATAASESQRKANEFQAKQDAAAAERAIRALRAEGNMRAQYATDVRKVAEYNANQRLFGGPNAHQLPELSFEEYVAANPHLRAMYGLPDDWKPGNTATPPVPLTPKPTQPVTNPPPTPQTPVPPPTDKSLLRPNTPYLAADKKTTVYWNPQTQQFFSLEQPKPKPTPQTSVQPQPYP